jgi:hypothetical protein
MSAEPLTCPYCNAFVSLPPDAQDGQRVTCLRCGDAFPLRGVGSGIKLPPGVTTAPAPGAGAARREPAGVSTVATSAALRNRVVAIVAVSIMALMAVSGLTFALLTQSQRRQNDSGDPVRNKRPIFPEPNDDTASTTASPAKLEALGYLPSNMNIVLGVHVRQLRQTKAGLALLSEPIKAGRSEVTLAKLLLWTGVEVEQLDHIVLGVRTDDVELPQVVAVARTWRKIDRRTVRASLQADEREEAAGPRKGQVLYRFQMSTPPVRPTLWFADDYTMVFDLLGQLESVPLEPRDGLDHLPAVRDALKTRVDAGSLIWAVATVADWEKTTNAKWFQVVGTFGGLLGKERLDRLRSVHVLALGAQLEPEAKVQVDVRCQDPKALRVALLGPEDAALPKGVTAFVEDDWLTVQWKGNLDTALKALAK